MWNGRTLKSRVWSKFRLETRSRMKFIWISSTVRLLRIRQVPLNESREIPAVFRGNERKINLGRTKIPRKARGKSRVIKSAKRTHCDCYSTSGNRVEFVPVTGSPVLQNTCFCTAVFIVGHHLDESPIRKVFDVRLNEQFFYGVETRFVAVYGYLA